MTPWTDWIIAGLIVAVFVADEVVRRRIRRKQERGE
jgi:hypothetical protein